MVFPAATSMSSSSLLLVDDHTSIRSLLATALARSGFTVVTAADGDEALRSASRNPPSLILLDLMMPRLDGWETIRLLRSTPITSTVPVIAITANQQVTSAQLREAGFSCHLPKPFRLQQVLRAITSCVEAAQRGESWVELSESGG